jgi:phosphatidylglycerophosphatase A
VSDRVALFVATAGGVGYSPVAPGTAGSAMTVVLLWVVPFSNRGLAVFLVAVIAVGTCRSSPSLLGGRIRRDRDLVAEHAVVLASLTPLVLLAGFLLFRIFDVVKPPPAHGSQKLRGGVGVMIDDLVAGAYALAVLALARGLTGWP